MNKKNVAVIVAGGTGKRMGEKLPKQFLPIAGRPIIAYCLETFQTNDLITDIVVVSHNDFVSKIEKEAQVNKITKLYRVVPGGNTRQESSFEGLKNCPPETEYVLIHDAVRPFIDNRMINQILLKAQEEGASTAAINVTDTIVQEQDGYIKEIPERNSLSRIQTPQGFKYSVIMEAHQAALYKGLTDVTDDCRLVLENGGKVALAQGSKNNIKITSREDLDYAEFLIKSGVFKQKK